MKKNIHSAQTDTQSKSVQEEIFKNRQIYTQEKKLEGPVIDLFYHELKDQSPKSRRFLYLVFGFMTYILHLILNPFILAYLKLSGVKSPYYYFTGVGQFGNTINARIYNVGYFQFLDDDDFAKEIPPFHLLYRTNIFKLPLIIDVLKGNLSLVGPELLEEDFAMILINKYTDFHKRFAPKPGVFSPACY